MGFDWLEEDDFEEEAPAHILALANTVT